MSNANSWLAWSRSACPLKVTSRLKVALLAGVAAMVTVSMAEPAAARKARDNDDEPAVQMTRKGGAPLVAIVSIRSQRVSIYDGTSKITGAPVSTGQPGHETPKGIFTIIQKEVDHQSNIYEEAEMPYMERITWSGVALHAGNLPGYPASHGCIRMPFDFAQKLFGMTRLGTRVIISRGDTAPVEFSHPNLFIPSSAPPDAPVAVSQAGGGFTPPMRLGVKPVAVTGPEAGVATPEERKSAAATAAESLRKAEALKQASAARAEEATRNAEAARKVAVARSAEATRAARAIRGAEGLKRQAEARIAMATRAMETATTPQARERAEQSKAALEAKFAAVLQGSEAMLADVEAKRNEAVKAAAEAQEAEAARQAAVAVARDAARRISPVTVFISRKTQRLYVRQALEPVFDVPVTIKDADHSIGTHVYTATGLSNDGATMRWTAVSVTGSEQPLEPRKGKSRRGQDDEAPSSRSAAAARTALDRIEMPNEAVARIAEVLSPGSSLIISDHGISHETGQGTDFVILTR